MRGRRVDEIGFALTNKDKVMNKIQKIWATFTTFAAVMVASSAALAADGVAAQGDGAWMSIAVAIGIGLAAFGGTMSQARVGSSALEGIARNPNATDKVFVPMILGLAFIESLVLFTWVLMFLLLGKI